MKTIKKNFKIICCYNAGENKTLEGKFTKKSVEIKFGFMSPGTPQKNGIVERGFSTLYSQIHAIMVHKGFHENLKTGIWPECAATATKLEKNMVNPHEEKGAHEKFYGKMLDYTK